MRPRVAELSPEADAATVSRLAAYLTRTACAYGALEVADLRSIAILTFYEVRDRWHGHGSFGSYVLRCMDGAVREARRREARQQTGYGVPPAGPSSKAARVAPQRAHADGHSASPTLEAQHRRRVRRREHNRTYDYRHRGLQPCDGCGGMVARGHGARRCDACASPTLRQARHRRTGQVQPCACGCGALVTGRWKRGHNNPRGWRRLRTDAAA